MAEQSRPWVVYNEQTATYDTRDGTKISVELVESANCLADVLHIASLREQMRAVQAQKGKPRKLSKQERAAYNAWRSPD